MPDQVGHLQKAEWSAVVLGWSGTSSGTGVRLGLVRAFRDQLDERIRLADRLGED
jgi:hypothetical protein